MHAQHTVHFPFLPFKQNTCGRVRNTRVADVLSKLFTSGGLFPPFQHFSSIPIALKRQLSEFDFLDIMQAFYSRENLNATLLQIEQGSTLCKEFEDHVLSLLRQFNPSLGK